MASDVGVYQELMDRVLAQQGTTLSYLARDWPELDQWRALARGKLLAVHPVGEQSLWMMSLGHIQAVPPFRIQGKVDQVLRLR